MTVSGADSLWGGTGNDRLVGEAAGDRLEGGFGRDTLSGGAGNDRLSGGEGNDRLAGDAGNDTLTGGRGADTFVFAAGPARDVDYLTDFLPRFDRLAIDLPAGAGPRDVTITALSGGGGTQIAFPGQVIILQGVAVGQVDLGDIQFF